jgi:AcrR family transcriptional regulator
MSGKRAPSQSRQNQIVETVLALVASHGTEAVSAQAVADAIGVTQPAVFRHFPTKEAMWLAVMAWLEQRLVAIYSTADAEKDDSAAVVLGRMFLDHIDLIATYPALAKLVFSDHLRLLYPSLQRHFGKIHKTYTERLCVLVERCKSEGGVSRSLSAMHAATAFLSLVQGLGFQFAIARLPLNLSQEGEHMLALFLQGIMSPSKSKARVHSIIEAAKHRRKRKQAA